MLYCLANLIIMNFNQNVCLDQFYVRFTKCYDTQVSITGPSWPSCLIIADNLPALSAKKAILGKRFLGN